MNTLEKIKAGQIRIENGKLKGLGMKGNESIDIEELNTLIEFTGTSGCINVLCKTIGAVVEIHSANLEEKEDQIKDYVNDDIIPALPNHRDVFVMQKMVKVFNTYHP